jgi:hypothetical protein
LAIIANGVGSAAGQSKREGSGTRPIPLAFFAGFWMLFPCRQEEFKKNRSRAQPCYRKAISASRKY